MLSHIINLFSIFSLSLLIIFLLINLPLYNYTFSNIYLLLPFYLPTTLYLNLTISPPSSSFYFDSSSSQFFYYKKLLFSIPFNPYFAHTKRWILSLSLSLSLYIYIYILFWWIFNFLDWWIFIFNSNLGWYDLVIF